MSNRRSLLILQVEDTPTDAMLTARAMALGDVNYAIQVVNDGAQAIAYLTQKEPYLRAPRPDLILLDLDLPKLNGNEVLRIIKADENLRTIPVIIFSTSESAENKQHAYELHANSYVVKPIDIETFTTRVQAIAEYWSKTSENAPFPTI
jgi:chemotaxis family two-component system response regulator Rcp1